MVIQYKCQNCGSDFAFDIEQNCLVCPHCKTTARVEDMPQVEDVDIPEQDEDEPEVEAYEPGPEDESDACPYPEDGTHEPGVFGDDAVEYHCNNCGAIILTEQNTAATWCHYCDAPVVLADRLTGQLAPTYVIPFRVTKEEAQKAFDKWCKGGLFTPRRFRDARKVKSIQGIYVPFWLFDLSGYGITDATGVKSRTYSRGNYIYTEKSFFHVYRHAKLNYLRLPADASEKMDDKIMDLLEPFHYEELHQFRMPFLSGFVAEKYSYQDKQLYDRVKQRAENFAKEYVRGSIKGYNTVKYNKEELHLQPMHADYTMLPVWMFCYDYEDKEHMFVMNGQTGKIVGTLPVDKKRVAGFWGLFTAGFFVLLELLFLLAHFFA